MTFANSDDLNSHILRRHSHFDTPSSPPLVTPSQAPANNHGISLLLEEQIDMAQTLKIFKESVLAQLSEIQSNQESFKTSLGEISSTQHKQNISLHRFEAAHSRVETQVKTISETLSLLSKPTGQESSNTEPSVSPPTIPTHSDPP